ncbi:ABA4-like family protein [Pseudooceanicola sp.]|uniref:ABA4-like family protein n=1 Tax=Pseudooceanicola sp. TaxID=1914328 RepID=UPI0040599E45
MTAYELFFYLIHLPVMVGWACLVFAPRTELTARVAHSGAIVLLLGLVYAGLLFTGVGLGQAAEGAGMASLPAVIALLSHPVGALTGWVHFILFDFFCGAWIARDAARLGLSHVWTVPVLILTLMFGPLGLAAHVLRRLATGAGLSLAGPELRPSPYRR